MNLNANALEIKLESLANKGLIFRIRRGDKTLFNAVPFMIGLYEYSVQQMNTDLAELYQDYYEQAYQKEMAVSDVPGFKVIPIGHTVAEEIVLIPACMLEEQVRDARVISVAPCICRKEAALTGRDCGMPKETCLHFGAAAEYYIENKIGRRISAEEALSIIKEADKEGLVHAGVNTKHLSNLCNCCPCCCASMKGITRKGMDKHGFLNALFIPVVHPDICSGCGICIERCPVGAITENGHDKNACREFVYSQVDYILETYGIDIYACGLCQTGVPCERGIPRETDG